MCSGILELDRSRELPGEVVVRLLFNPSKIAENDIGVQRAKNRNLQPWFRELIAQRATK